MGKKRNVMYEKMMREIERQAEKEALLNDPMLWPFLKLKKEKKKIDQELYKMNFLPHYFYSEKARKDFEEERERLLFMSSMYSAAISSMAKERAKLERYQPKSKRKQL